MDEFTKLYSSSLPRIPSDLENLLPISITDEEINALMCIAIEKEIKDCVWSLHPLKALSPNSFSRIFFRKFWQVVKEKVINFVKECFWLKSIPFASNKMYIVLVPKVVQPLSFDHFRPISLCNFSYKIVAKIIATRMRSFIGKLISQNQGAILKSRWIANNTVATQEVLHKIQTYRGKNGLMALKVDL